MKYVLGGHWTTVPEGWEILTEADQDLTTRLKWPNDAVETIFSCHVVEHLAFVDAVLFFQEALRVLKSDGILRTVCPFIDMMVKFSRNKFDALTPLGRELQKNYTKTSLLPYYPAQNIALKDMGIDFTDHGLPFFFDSLIKGHGHKFLWSTSLMAAVLTKIGFSEVRICLPGESEFDQSNCLERVVRGIDRDAFPAVVHYDVESLVVEARK